MKFKKGDKVKFINENKIFTGEITGITIFSTGNFNYSVDVNMGSDIVSFHMVEDELALAKPLVTIPQFVSDNIRKDKDADIALYTSFIYINSINDYDDKLYNWLMCSDNEEVYAEAWVNGYEIEKEQLYYVKVLDDSYSYLNLIKANGKYFVGSGSKSDEYKTKFTEREIKMLDERFWAFAIPVGEVEEAK